MSQPRVAVIGGGLAGIAAALDGARAGAAVTLLESRGRLGGQAYSFMRDGVRADNGQHVFLRCCTEYRRLVADLGADELVTMQPRLRIPVLAPGGRRAWLSRSGLPSPLHLVRALLRYPFLTLPQRLNVARAMQSLGRVDPDDPRADRRSFGDWLREHGQGPAAVETVWELIGRATLNLTADGASLAQAAQVFQLGLLHDAAAGDVGHARAPLSDIHDVAGRRALQAAGVEVRTRCGATGIATTDGGFTIELHGGSSLTADGVVLAVPPARAVRLAPAQAGLHPATPQRLGRSPIVNLHVVYDRRILDWPFAVGVHSPVQWVFDRTEGGGVTEGQYLVVSLSAADAEIAATPEQLRARYLPALADLLPPARGAEVRRFFVTRDHAATFRAAPGVRAHRPPARTALPGLALAGAWTDTGWPATMEGAVRSGHAAAAEVLEALRQAATVRVPQGELAA